MMEWWDSLTKINQTFYSAAAFFSVFFIWQLIAVFFGLDEGDSDVDGDIDGDGTYDHFEHGAESDALESVTSFKLLSVRSIITFFTLFTWGTAFTLNEGQELGKSMAYGSAWGLAGMIIVALLFYMLKKLVETGNKKIATCVGTEGTVYLNIPKNGTGEIRVTVSDVVSHVKARGVDGKAIVANTPVKVLKLVGQNTVEVEEVK
jgi:hypothetical protein